MATIRRPAVAGTFYPGESRTLARTVHELLDGTAPTQSAPATVYIAPHAGYIYSGRTAAIAYSLLARSADHIGRVVILGPTHRVAIRGIALPGATHLATPLGKVPVDDDGARLAASLPHVVTRPDVHEHEHSLEVHLPFLQHVLPDATVVPLAVGEVEPDAVADVLDALVDEETAVIVSSDLSHYLPYDEARRADAATIEQIMSLEPVHSRSACGARPVNGLLVWARRRGLEPELLDACNSGDTAGTKDRVVGYAAVAFRERTPREPA